MKQAHKKIVKTVILLLLCGYVLVSLLQPGLSSLDTVESLSEYEGDLASVSDTDPAFIRYIQRKLLPPAPRHVPLKLYGEVGTGQIGQAQEVLDYFKGKSHGVFVEAGAFNGEYLSNTLYLETNYTWTGLLVEPNSAAYKGLSRKKRKSYCIHSCLSVVSHPDIVEFDAADVFGGINEDITGVDNARLKKMRNSIPDQKRRLEKVECYPLYSLLLSIGQERNIDFFSLDVEGAELAVLKTIPWDKVRIELVMIEVNHSNKAEIDNVMISAGYQVHKVLSNQDIIYRLKS